MLRPRIIPCLLISKKGLVKTVNFKNPKYIGDPINAVKIFNEKEVDEIMILDIDASTLNQPPNFSLIEKLALECRMPLAYGGGIKKIEDVITIIKLGCEKVVISSAAILNPILIKEASNKVGKQSISVVADVKKNFFGNYNIFFHNGTVECGISLKDFVKKMEDFGAGEIVLNSIDYDGTGLGYDLDLVEYVRDLIDIPITVLGGAGTLNDVKKLVNKFGIIGAAAGSLFVLKGKYRAVLISYPSYQEKLKIF